MSGRIELENVSVRFRMSYHKIYSSTQALAEIGRRITRRWQPEYFTGLDDVSLSIGNGEIVGVIGRNGCGKSTLLRTVSGIYYPDQGSVSVTGRVSALLQLGTGFNIQLSGRDNIVLGGLTLGLDQLQIREQMGQIIEFAALGEFIDVPMRYYSSGMMSRLSFAMVVSLEPDILLIDETLSVGDHEFQSKSQKAMQRLIEQASCQMIVSHSMDTIRSFCTRVIMVESGKIVMDDKPDVVVREYLQAACGESETPMAAQVHPSLPGED